MRVQRWSMLLLLTIVPVLAGCGPLGSSDSPDSASLVLDWYPWSNHAGFFLAQQNGYFKDQKLNVKINVPSTTDDVLQLVGSGHDTFGISYETDVLLARQQGIPVVSIAALVQQPLNTVMALKTTGITHPKQLEGKKVGYPGIPSDEALLSTMMKADGGDSSKVQLVNVGFDLVPALISGKVDAIIGGYDVHESILAEQQGDPVNVMHVQDWGVPNYYELVVVANENTIKKDPAMVERFVQAMTRGYTAAAANHTAALNSIVAKYPDTDVKMETVGMERLAPLWTAGAPMFGWQTTERWQQMADWMTSHQLLNGSVDASAAFTNQFIANQTKNP
ncbi:MAG TPA: ABC transporter substrate-binding protein [Nitrolancea sp.]|jgi:putative hydroxymethylpyrimidine transport system substrate-binding protein|nr:ABC transporter substrate-binding protein [Nitrolancea sp.]